MNNNGLFLNSVNTTVKAGIEIKTLDEINNYIRDNSFIVAYLDNEVLFGTYRNSILNFYNNKTIEIEYLKRIRIFNKNEELHIWYSNGNLIGRYRKDTEGEKTDVIDANQVIFGTESKNIGDYTILTEKRGTKIILPGNWEVNDKRKRVALKTRHYIEYLKGYQASYCDSRFIEFVQLPFDGGK